MYSSGFSFSTSQISPPTTPPRSEAPPAASFVSPLKRRLHQLVQNSTAESFSKAGRQTDKSSTRETKKIRCFLISKNTTNPIPTGNLSAQLKESVDLIENYAARYSVGSFTLVEIRHRIITVLNSPELSEEGQIIELGLLYFYLSTNKSLPAEKSLLLARMTEIHTVAKGLKMEHKRLALRDDSISSGLVVYIQRAFVRMIFTPGGGFNLGGALAVRACLEEGLGSLLTSEMRQQILVIVERLIAKPAFRALFQGPFNLHPVIADLIAIDLKLPKNETLNETYVCWDLLISLFTVIGQIGEGNCFAVSTCSNLLSENPDLMLQQILELLKTGTLNFQGVEFPLPLLMDSRRVYEVDFHCIMSHEQVTALTAFGVASSVLRERSIPEIDGGKVKTLEEWIELYFGVQANEAKEIFLSFKQNFLQQMMLATLEFIALNRFSKEEAHFSDSRAAWLGDLTTYFFQVFLKRCTEIGIAYDLNLKNYLDRFYLHLFDRFFAIDARNWSFSETGERIVTDFHSTGFLLNGDTEDYHKLLKLIRRIFFLQDGNLEYVQHLSQLGACFIKCVDEITLPNDPEHVLKASVELKKYFASSEFCELVAKRLETKNKQRGNTLCWLRYFDSDAFFLNSSGADPRGITTFERIEERYKTPITLTSPTVEMFFKTLCDHIREFVEAKPDYVSRRDPQMLISDREHAFNINPLRFKRHWQSSENALQNESVLPAVKLLDQLMTPKQKSLVLHYCIEESDFDSFNDLISNEMSARDFKTAALAKLKPELHALFYEGFNMMMESIPISKFGASICEILENNGIEVSDSVFEEMNPYFEKRQKDSFLLPSKGAALVHKALKNAKPPQFIPIYRLEQIIRESFDIPQVVDLGNLNWVEKFSEKLKFLRLILKYDLAQEKLAFFCRKKGLDIPYFLSDSLLERTFLLFESD